MNKWNCDEPGCPYSCVGLGGAVGLRAIGWYFEKGDKRIFPKIFCPIHHPDFGEHESYEDLKEKTKVSEIQDLLMEKYPNE